MNSDINSSCTDRPEKENSQCEIESTVASFRNLAAQAPIKNAVVYFWESHTKNPDDKQKVQAAIDLIPKRFDLFTCEKFEVRTGYLSRYNYLKKPYNESSLEELEVAIARGENQQVEWIKRCEPRLCDFVKKNWQECIGKVNNPHYASCKELLMRNIQDDESFARAYVESANNYAIKRGTNKENGLLYLIEENAWILSLPLLHPDKQIYIIHVGNVTDSTTILFSTFDYLGNSAKLLFPYFENKTFSNIADFQMEYKNKSNYGYFVNNKELVSTLTQAKREQNLTREDLLELLIEERSENELLHNIIGKLPGHVYWLSRKNVYLGCNDTQAKHLGLNSRDEIVGKTVFDLLPAEEARKHFNINKMIIEKEKSYSGEEKASMHNGFRTYLSHKIPLVNSSGKTVGLLGISVDITDRKKAEELRLKNKMQKAKLEGQKIIYDQIAHDIRSPLAALSMITKNCKGLSEKEHVALRNLATSIENITSDLLNKYKESKEKESVEPTFSEQYISIYISLLEILNNKRYQYRDLDVTFNFSCDPLSNFAFIRGDYSDFCRMISNLINNSVEALEGRQGIIEVSFTVKNQKVGIAIKDGGKGMPKEMVGKFMRNIPVGSTKESGYGIGMQQVKSTLQQMNGQMSIKSTENVGTEITLLFPESEPPVWVTGQIVLYKGETVVVLDDDPSIHSVWENRLKEYSSDITIKYFTQGSEAIDYINSSKEKDKILLLADYELRNQDINGVDVIEKTNMQKQSILVTSVYTYKMENFSEKAKFLKMVSKLYMNEIPVVMEEAKATGKADIVFIDDNKT
ncbi:hypothetical protein FACS189449_03810 [Alphaproteobacteria bacterium]|nr:hypothetical protein FACS189449_03810 [Alphaproteobacteria bacterium]